MIGKKDKVNPKVSRKLQYNTAIAYFLIGNFIKAKEILSLDEKNTKSKSGLFSGFSSKFDFIKNQYAYDGTLSSAIQGANNTYYLIDSGFNLMNFIKLNGNVLGKN
jgi:type IV secretory pathway component VirB8